MKLTEVEKKPTAIVYKAGVTDKSIEDYIKDKKFELSVLKSDMDEDVLKQVLADRKLKLTFYKAPVRDAYAKVHLGIAKDVKAKAELYGVPLKVRKVSERRCCFNIKFHVFYMSEHLTFDIDPSYHGAVKADWELKAKEMSKRYYYKGQMRELNVMRVQRMTEADFEAACKRANVLDLTDFVPSKSGA